MGEEKKVGLGLECPAEAGGGLWLSFVLRASCFVRALMLFWAVSISA